MGMIRRMRRIAAFATALLLIPAAASAQSIGQSLPGRSDPLERPAKPLAQKPAAARPCPEYGAGFVRIEGSSLCVRAGGAVRAEFGKSSSRNGYGSAADGMVHLESRGQTGLGEVRSVLQVRGRVDRGDLSAGPFRY